MTARIVGLLGQERTPGTFRGAMRSGGSRMLILTIIVVAALVALVPIVIGHGRNVRLMREGLQVALSECRARYAMAHSREDTVRADRWVPRGAGSHDGDPACGSYRRRSMLSRAG